MAERKDKGLEGFIADFNGAIAIFSLKVKASSVCMQLRCMQADSHVLKSSSYKISRIS